ncbi:carbohydrate sulfotransferase 11-like [Lingula anatina]|uniref:Carbohydrate sulfotransferase n=1 Tax=Lingula anatina TaxID=7574 RepID=A0A1S3JG16_LINAN|nr:carbohydrate sulfotransferase 11-like [Lingula anatina]|eukprot:XP_013409350.1 carbohydrate sulfotransferase 11-like [Lingula anatina]
MAFRKQRTKWACQHYGSGARTPLNPPSSEELQYIWVSDDLQLVYCEVPKAASSLWKMLILKAKGYPIKSSESVHMIDFPQNLRRLDTYSSSEIENILNHYLKFLILRHPADRLVSAYRDKIKFWKPQNPRALSRVGNYVNQLKGLPPFYPTDIPEDDTQLYYYLKRKINSGAELWDTMTSLRPSNVTFRDFVRYVADHSDAPDKHWAPIHRQCHPCYINYDIISYYETMKEDGANILKLVQHDTDLRIKEKTQSSCPKCLRTSKMFERIYEPEMGKIKQMYQLDWAMALGETDFLKSP